MIPRTATIAALLVTLAAAGGCSKKAKGPAQAGARIAITVTEKGFEPDHIKIRKGVPVTLAFERKTDRTCAKEVVIHLDDKQTIEKQLPLDQVVEVAVTFPSSGDLSYACGMDMIKGSIHVQ